MFRQVIPDHALMHMKEEDASCDEAAANHNNNMRSGVCDEEEPPLRLFVE